MSGDYVYLMSVLIVAALKSEVKFLLTEWGIRHQEAVEKHAVHYQCDNGAQILRTGVGLAKTARVLHHFKNRLPRKMLHIGVCGALSGQFQVGDVVKANAYVNEAGEWVTPKSWPLFPTAGLFRQTIFLSVTEAVRSDAGRMELAEQTGAGVADMESFAVAKFCQHYHLSLVSLRIVSDLADDRAISTFQTVFRKQAAALQRVIMERWAEINAE
ncbi:MAG: hypothetical protein K9N34_08130 [Candidatus Marinimicrobia bacterium]|nr:hypothetical protein [Candidatus Neomarinimicrobiota bacterium]MCF7839873.1 hypothetical protein [Candidatus Neomarinimicrobiota bacterium]MCF7902661.1 hypothetical protein [Candidatus Neomarinimicrobiota bacterium]